MRGRVILAAALLVVLGVAGFYFYESRQKAKDRQAKPVATAPTGPRTPTGHAAETPAPPPDEGRVRYDDDPRGTFRVEGQVVDAGEHGVDGAIVTVSSHPPRTAKTEGDGSFVFEGLLPRAYTFEATDGERVGGPTTARVHQKTEPVILRLRAGATLEVLVRDGASQQPIAEASVEVRGVSDRAARADRDGKAVVKGLAPGGHVLAVSAAGYAPTWRIVRLRSGEGVVERETVELTAGAPVAGTVVDAAGKPVAGALVVAETAGQIYDLAEPSKDGVTTDDKGRWRFAALPAGSFRFSASHERHAPGVSEPISLTGLVERTGVIIQLAAAGRIAGKVVDAQGAPAPLATVRVARGGDGISWDVTRQAATDEKGEFDIGGLPRAALDVVASHELGSSTTAVVDLAAQPERTGLVLTLDITGSIAGVVVGSDDQPIPEAEVTAVADLLSHTYSASDWRLRGTETDVTDAGGRFELRGLVPGSYELVAARPGASAAGAWLRKGSKAQTGEKDVKIVLAADGGIKGKVAFSDGEAPELFTVRWSLAPPTPFHGDGAFRVGEVPPGSYDVTVNGPGFMEKVVRDVEVKPAADTDVGTVTVEKGRSVSGRVLDANGQAVAGATVLAGQLVMGSGTDVKGGFPGMRDSQRETTSDERGDYVLAGIPPKTLALLADHKDKGRSATVQLPPGRESARVDLVVQPTGALTGKVLRDGAGVEAAVFVSAQGATRGRFTVKSGADGAFRFDRLAPDWYLLAAATSGESLFSASMHTQVVQVRSGETTNLDIVLPSGTSSLTVKASQGGKPVQNAQVVLMEGSVHVPSVEGFQEVAIANPGALKQDLLIEGKAVTFKGLRPGMHTTCAIALPGDIMDPKVLARLQQDPNSLQFGCVTTEVRDSTTVTVVIPPEPKPPE